LLLMWQGVSIAKHLIMYFLCRLLPVRPNLSRSAACSQPS
jgi:hypothetical protein